MSSTPNLFQQFAAAIGDQAFMAVNQVVTATLTDIQTNPQSWLNPLSAPVKGAAVVAQLAAAVPNLEDNGVASAAQLVEALWTQLGQKLAAAAPTTATETAAVTGTPAPTPSPEEPTPVA
jgi:hypothetical protein